MSPPLVVLLPSPLLGPAVWQPVADRLARESVVVPASGATPAQVLAGLLDRLPSGRDLVLVPHSGAGLYVGALAAARSVVAAVLADAGIPHPTDVTPTAPAAFLDRLRALADEEGLLPPWTRWWPEADVAPLFPDEHTREAVEAEQPRLPLTYFTSAVPAAPGWEQRVRCGYLAFGGTYAEELARAQAAGWPVRRLEGGHLHQLVDPAAVAAQVDDLVGELLS